MIRSTAHVTVRGTSLLRRRQTSTLGTCARTCAGSVESPWITQSSYFRFFSDNDTSHVARGANPSSDRIDGIHGPQHELTTMRELTERMVNPTHAESPALGTMNVRLVRQSILAFYHWIKASPPSSLDLEHFSVPPQRRSEKIIWHDLCMADKIMERLWYEVASQNAAALQYSTEIHYHLPSTLFQECLHFYDETRSPPCLPMAETLFFRYIFPQYQRLKALRGEDTEHLLQSLPDPKRLLISLANGWYHHDVEDEEGPKHSAQLLIFLVDQQQQENHTRTGTMEPGVVNSLHNCFTQVVQSFLERGYQLEVAQSLVDTMIASLEQKQQSDVSESLQALLETSLELRKRLNEVVVGQQTAETTVSEAAAPTATTVNSEEHKAMEERFLELTENGTKEVLEEVEGLFGTLLKKYYSLSTTAAAVDLSQPYQSLLGYHVRLQDAQKATTVLRNMDVHVQSGHVPFEYLWEAFPQVLTLWAKDKSQEAPWRAHEILRRMEDLQRPGQFEIDPSLYSMVSGILANKSGNASPESSLKASENNRIDDRTTASASGEVKECLEDNSVPKSQKDTVSTTANFTAITEESPERVNETESEPSSVESGIEGVNAAIVELEADLTPAAVERLFAQLEELTSSGENIDRYSFNRIFEILSRIDGPHGAKAAADLLELMIAYCSEGSSPIEPDLFAFNAVTKSMVKSGATLEQVEKLQQRMRNEFSVSPDNDSYHMLIESCANVSTYGTSEEQRAALDQAIVAMARIRRTRVSSIAMSYVTLVEAICRLLPTDAPDDRNKMLEHTFALCCADGVMSQEVIMTFKKSMTQEAWQRLYEDQLVDDGQLPPWWKSNL